MLSSPLIPFLSSVLLHRLIRPKTMNSIFLVEKITNCFCFFPNLVCNLIFYVIVLCCCREREISSRFISVHNTKYVYVVIYRKRRPQIRKDSINFISIHTTMEKKKRFWCSNGITDHSGYSTRISHIDSLDFHSYWNMRDIWVNPKEVIILIIVEFLSDIWVFKGKQAFNAINALF